LDENDEHRMTFFNIVKNINNSPQKDNLAAGDVFELANIINKSQNSEFNIEPHRISEEDISGGMEYEPSKIRKSESESDSQEFQVFDELVEEPESKGNLAISVL
jgi:hypothetical protein